MKQTFILLFIIGSSLSAWAQTAKGNGKIKGQVVDAETNQPVEFANIVLIDQKTEKTVDGAMCDMEGKFELTKVAEGTYNVSVTFIGYETKIIENVVIDGKKAEVELPAIKLSTGAKVLNEVVVEGQRELIEEKVDRTVYNAEQDATTRGGDASDVLKRVPMLSVDMDGNVSMRGNSNITVLINNKPSTVMASSIADALKQIPADQIKSVEVITSPSAKYDAEGSAGIINIITKKNTLEGATLNIDGGVGLRGSNLGLNGNYRRGKMGFSLGGFGRANYNVKGSFNSDQTLYTENGENTISQRSDTRRNDLNGRYTLGWDYDINAKNYIAASVRYGVRNGNNYQDKLTRSFNDVINQVWDTESNDKSGTIDVSVDYTHLYEKPQRELSFSAQYSRNNRTNDFYNRFFDTDFFTTIDSLSKNNNKSYNQEVTAQLDYQTPISTNQMLEMGAKTITRKVSSDFQSYYADENGVYQPVANNRNSNALNYDQNVTSGYLSYTLSTKAGYALKAGARYEYTTINAYYREEIEGVSEPEIPSYGVLVPSINLSKKLKNGNTLKLAYNRRIQRPSIRFLNPNVDQSNIQNISVGNPELDPEFTNNYELGYSTYIKSVTLNFSAFVRNTTGSIQSIRDTLGIEGVEKVPGQITTRYDNIGEENAYGLSTFIGVNIGGKLTLNGGGDVYYAMLNNNNPDPQLAASNEGWVWSGRMFGNYSLPKNWAVQFFGFYRGNRVNLQGWQGGFGTYSMGLRKEFNDKKASIGFAAENFFTTSMKIRSETFTPTFDQRSVNTMRNMSFRITFNYRIGKMGFDNQRQRRRRSVNNDDMKDGGGGGMDMDMGNQNQGGGQRGGNGMPQFNQMTNAAPDSTLVADVNAVVDATGTWSFTIESPQGPNTGTFDLKKDGDLYSGTITSARTNTATPLESVTVNGNELTLTYSMSFGGNSVPVTIKGIITDNSFNGNASFGQFRTTPIKATKN